MVVVLLRAYDCSWVYQSSQVWLGLYRRCFIMMVKRCNERVDACVSGSFTVKRHFRTKPFPAFTPQFNQAPFSSCIGLALRHTHQLTTISTILSRLTDMLA